MLKNILVDYNPIVKISNKIFEKFTLLANLSDHIKGLLFDSSDKSLEKILFLLGITAITYKTASFLYKNY